MIRRSENIDYFGRIPVARNISQLALNLDLPNNLDVVVFIIVQVCYELYCNWFPRGFAPGLEDLAVRAPPHDGH